MTPLWLILATVKIAAPPKLSARATAGSQANTNDAPATDNKNAEILDKLTPAPSHIQVDWLK